MHAVLVRIKTICCLYSYTEPVVPLLYLTCYSHYGVHALLTHSQINIVHSVGAIQSVDALILPGVKAIMSKTVLPEDHG